MQAAIRSIEYYLPDSVLSTADLAAQFPEWPVEKIDKKTGIQERHIAAPGECASDLALAAAKNLFASGAVSPADIDCLLLCTQSPDFFLPTTACLLQDRMGIPTSCAALDFNQGCSGFIYGLGLAKGLIETGQAQRVLLLTADTYSKFIHPLDRSVRTIFGDAAAATLIEGVDAPGPLMGPFVWGTDGRGAENLIVPAGGTRLPRSPETAREVPDANGVPRSRDNLFMDGAEIFQFALDVVPKAYEEVLRRAGATAEDVDLFVFHQANKYMLNSLRMTLNIPEERFYTAMRHCGNTVSSTIPIALKHALLEGRLIPGKRVMLMGFGVGYSWGATLLRWAGQPEAAL
jgi:3-oxoacyl-[acyl-carrier-protein] synthase-3